LAAQIPDCSEKYKTAANKFARCLSSISGISAGQASFKGSRYAGEMVFGGSGIWPRRYRGWKPLPQEWHFVTGPNGGVRHNKRQTAAAAVAAAGAAGARPGYSRIRCLACAITSTREEILAFGRAFITRSN
jgi:hypothetical protein